MNIIVLCGGLSDEREVSLLSGTMVREALMQKEHNVKCLDVYFGNEVKNYTPTFSSPPQAKELKKKRGDNMLFSPKILPYCRTADIVFLALHGGMGENGQLQALLDCYGIKYTGSSYSSSLMCMDKEITKIMLKNEGISVPNGVAVKKCKEFDIEKIPMPCIVKPSCGGSSVGTVLVNSLTELKDAIKNAFQYCDTVLCEEIINGRELTVGIVDGKALPIIEIIPKQGFYDYKNKYINGRCDEICPAPLEKEMSDKIKSAALKCSQSLKTKYCRVDFILRDDVPYCLEINTLPGMTPTSLLPLAASKEGISYGELCQKIINEAI